MQTWLVVFSVLVLVGLAGALLWLTLRVRHLSAVVTAFSGDAAVDDEVPDLSVPDQRPRVVVDVLNPIELARANSRYARGLIGVAPGLVRRRVYEIVVRELRYELEQRGVEAEVDIHRPG